MLLAVIILAVRISSRVVIPALSAAPRMAALLLTSTSIAKIMLEKIFLSTLSESTFLEKACSTLNPLLTPRSKSGRKQLRKEVTYENYC